MKPKNFKLPTVNCKLSTVRCKLKTLSLAILPGLIVAGLVFSAITNQLNSSKTSDSSPSLTLSPLSEDSSKDDPWLEGWQYRKSITIDNSSSSNSLTDYQVLITIDTQNLISAGKMRSDCGDIRFTDSDGATTLNYWLESGCNTTSTKIWVKVPSIPASSTKTIYVYYGNPDATSQSNGANTFLFFDNFSSYSVGSNIDGQGGWSVYKYSTNSYTDIITFNGKNHLRIYSAQYATNVKHAATIPNSVRVIANAYYYSGNQAFSTYLYDGSTYTSYYEPGNSYYWMMESGSNHYDLCKFIGTTKTCLAQSFVDSPTGHYYRMELLWYGTSLKGNTLQDGNSFTSASATDSSFSSHSYLALTAWEWAGSAATYYVDYVFISKYVSPEPTTSIGSEEEVPTLILQGVNLQGVIIQ